MPHAQRSFRPLTIAGSPGTQAPIAFTTPGTMRWTTWSAPGVLSERCGSFARIGNPEALRAAPTANTLLARRSGAASARSAGSARPPRAISAASHAGDPRVDALGVPRHRPRAAVAAVALPHPVGEPAQVEELRAAVGLEQRVAEPFRQMTVGGAPCGLELPQTLARGDEAPGEVEIA